MARGDIYNAEEIRILSQEFGLNDRLIAEKLGCERVTVTKLRKRHNIPTCEIRNREDKSYVCVTCGATVYIKRKQRRRLYCDQCNPNIPKKKKAELNKIAQEVGILGMKASLKELALPSLSD